jgi:hypothetical protein
MPVIQDLAGHASIIMTRRYTHPADERKQQAVEALLRSPKGLEPATETPTPVEGRNGEIRTASHHSPARTERSRVARLERTPQTSPRQYGPRSGTQTREIKVLDHKMVPLADPDRSPTKLVLLPTF